MKCILIRHGKTAGNLEHRYIGSRSDEPLCSEGRAILAELTVPPVEAVYCSPMQRCLQTAAILYPDHTPIIIDDLRECDFGAFEGLNYNDLNGRDDYQAWIDSGGELPFPGGESRAQMEERVALAYQHIVDTANCGTIAVIAHGGTLMSVMARYALPKRYYFDYMPGNNAGYILHTDGSWQCLTPDQPLEAVKPSFAR